MDHATADTGSDAQLANKRLREDLAAAYRGMDYYRLGEGICNHLTVRAPARNGKGEIMLLIAYGTHWSQVTASLFVGVDIKTGEVVEGKGQVEKEAVVAHTAIYKALGGAVNSIMHTHSPYATSLDPQLKMVHQSSMRFYGKIAYDLDYGGTVAMKEESSRLAEKMAGKEILVMGSHGVLAVGKSAGAAFDNLYYFERAAMFQMLAYATGRELAEVSDSVAQRVANAFDSYEDGFKIDHLEAVKKILEGKQPDFRS